MALFGTSKYGTIKYGATPVPPKPRPPVPGSSPLYPKLHNIYMDKIVAQRYADQYELVKIDVANDTYSLRKLSTNEISLVRLETLNVFYQIRTNYIGHV